MGFFIGCVTSEIYIYCTKNLKFDKLFTLFCSVSIIVLCVLPIRFGYDLLKRWDLIYIFAFFPALVVVVLRLKLVTTILSIKPLLYLGELSYSIYLLHFPMQLILKTLDEHFTLSINYSSKIVFTGFSLAVIVVSHFIHYYFEMPIQSYIRKKFLS
jgi:peptidoglycan/LPS O-acetylase OafA/YrhL